MLRRLEAMLAVADREASLIITGNGDVLEPEHGIDRDRLGRRLCAGGGDARCCEQHRLGAGEIVKQVALTIAGDLCIYTNQNHVIEVLE